MQISLTLSLPRDALSVPVARRVIQASLGVIGVESESVADVTVALSEACTNVLDHARDGDSYDVVFELRDTRCVITVADLAQGFDLKTLSPAGAAADAEHGRGYQLMRALVDRVRFTSDSEDGTIVRLEKTIRYDAGAPLAPDG